MAYKDSTAERTTITRNLRDMENSTGNIYETIVVLSKRSNQINVEMKEELNQKLDEFATSTDNLEEIFENREQIEVSRYYERLPKSGAIAMQEMEGDKIFWKSPEIEQEAEDSEE
jgi:DNA-directed RNA polymerase subunit K/omega